MSLKPESQDALIVVDVQNDFMPGGALAVPNGDEIVPVINRLLDHFDLRVFTRDWHPAGHVSFANRPEFKDKSWPVHCVQNTPGVRFYPGVRHDLAHKIVNKGSDRHREAYSGFEGTDLEAWLKRNNIRRVFVVGLAADYCVKATALDAKQAGFETVVIHDATRPVDNPPGSAQTELDKLKAAGIPLIPSREILGT